MAKPLQNITVAAPGFAGLNTQDSPIGIDPSFAAVADTRELDTIGVQLPMQPFGQGFKDMAPAVDKLERLVVDHKLAHGDNPVLNMCAANAIAERDPAGNRKLNKAKSIGRIDGLVALAMALGSEAMVEAVTASSPWDDPAFELES